MTDADDLPGPERGHKRIRAWLDTHLVADTTAVWLVWEHRYYPRYYIPLTDLRADLVSVGAVRDPRLGAGEVYDVRTAGGTAVRAAIRYLHCPDPRLREAVRLEWAAMTTWWEEDEPVHTHARDPYKRVDVLRSSRHVVVEIDGVQVAESTRPVVLFETLLEPRYYLPLPDVRQDWLRPSATSMRCPYKGTSSYYDLTIEGRRYPDAAWTYRAPVPEAAKIADLVCFTPGIAEVSVDGVRLPPR